MNINNDSVEYDLLGFKVKVKKDVDGDDLKNEKSKALSSINLVRERVDKIKEKAPHLKDGEVAILAALELANDYQELSSEYEDNISRLSTTAKDALGFIEEISPIQS